MGGSTKKIDTTPDETARLRSGVVDYLMQPGGGASGFGTRGNGTGSPYDRIFAANAPAPVAPTVASTAPIGSNFTTSSVDTLGGANSPFFQNLMAQLKPSFDTERALALAAGKEGAGNLTGSGYAASVGNQLNRSLGQEQATLADYATRGLQTEVQRQQGDAARAAQIAMQNQNVEQQRNFLQAQIQDAIMRAIFGEQSATARSNAGNFTQLLGSQATAGVSPDTVKTSGGIGALLGSIGSLLGQFGPSIFNHIFGGGGGDINIPAYVPPPDIPSNFPTYKP